MFVELVPSLRCSHGTISCFPFCVAFVFVVCLDECHTWRTRSGQCCVFPILWYGGSLRHSCWGYPSRCSLTADYLSDRKRDWCDGKPALSVNGHTVRLSSETSHYRPLDHLRFWAFYDVTFVINKSTNRARFVNLLTCVSRSRSRIIHVHMGVSKKWRRQGAVDQPHSAGAPVHDFLLQYVRFHYGLPRHLHPGNVRRKREDYLGAVRQQGACLERGTLEHQWGGPIPRELSSAMRSDVTSVPQYCHVGLATNIT